MMSNGILTRGNSQYVDCSQINNRSHCTSARWRATRHGNILGIPLKRKQLIVCESIVDRAKLSSTFKKKVSSGASPGNARNA